MKALLSSIMRAPTAYPTDFIHEKEISLDDLINRPAIHSVFLAKQVTGNNVFDAITEATFKRVVDIAKTAERGCAIGEEAAVYDDSTRGKLHIITGSYSDDGSSYRVNHIDNGVPVRKAMFGTTMALFVSGESLKLMRLKIGSLSTIVTLPAEVEEHASAEE